MISPLLVCASVIAGLLYRWVFTHVNQVKIVFNITKALILFKMPKCIRSYFDPAYVYSEAKHINDNTVQIYFTDNQFVKGTVLLVRETKRYTLLNKEGTDVTFKYKQFYDWEQILPSSDISVNYITSTVVDSTTT